MGPNQNHTEQSNQEVIAINLSVKEGGGNAIRYRKRKWFLSGVAALLLRLSVCNKRSSDRLLLHPPRCRGIHYYAA